MTTYGHDVNHNEDCFDNAVYQGTQPTCAIRCQQIILRDYGIQIPQNELASYAQEKGWFDGDGTRMGDIGNLLETCGVGVHASTGNSIEDLLDELNAGHRVIVGVDSRELWAEPGSEAWQFFNSIDNPDHAIIVAGMRIDPDYPDNNTVILTDPGRGDAFIEYPMEHFRQAWEDAHFFMMATDEAAPYQYNAERSCMEPSNFATDYSVAEFPFHNELSGINEYVGSCACDDVPDDIDIDDDIDDDIHDNDDDDILAITDDDTDDDVFSWETDDVPGCDIIDDDSIDDYA